MASVRIEGEAFNDRRYNRLAERAGLADPDHARGKMAALWLQCTIEKRYVLPVRDVTEVLGECGVEALEFADLGELVDGGVRIRGTRGRIEWLENLRKNGKKGGRPPGTRSKATQKPEAKPSGSGESNPPAPALVPSPVPVLVKNPEPPNPPKGGSSRKSRKSDFNDIERAQAMRVIGSLNQYSESEYRGSDTHVGMIVARLREGKTVLDLRKVAWHCALGLKWATEHKEKMGSYLRPETLFGPQNIERYLDPALSAYRKQFGTDEEVAEDGKESA